MLFLVGELDIPSQTSRAGVEAEQVGIIGFCVDKVLPDGNAAVLVGGGIVEQTLADRALIVPYDSASARVERKNIVGGCDIHDPANDDGCGLEASGVGRMENPGSTELPDILGIDLSQTAVAAAGVIAVIRSPIGCDGASKQVRGIDFCSCRYLRGRRLLCAHRSRARDS